MALSKHNLNWLVKLISYILVSLSAFGCLADLLVITREDTDIAALTREQVSELWLKKSQRVNGINITVTDINEKAPVRSKFYTEIVGMSDRQLKAYWAIKVFRGDGFPPDSLKNSEEIKSWVADGRGRLGYFSGTEIEPPLKIVYRMED